MRWLDIFKMRSFDKLAAIKCVSKKVVAVASLLNGFSFEQLLYHDCGICMWCGVVLII